MVPSLATLQGNTLLSSPLICRFASFGTFQYFAISARVGCLVPTSSVQRDISTVSVPSHFQGKPERVCAIGYAGVFSSAGFQLCPPSSETSTVRIAPDPDHAKPVIS